MWCLFLWWFWCNTSHASNRFDALIYLPQWNYMMTSSNGNTFRVTGPLCGEFTGPRWIPRTKASDASFDVFFDLRINGWVNNRKAGDFRHHRVHYDVTVMSKSWSNCHSVASNQKRWTMFSGHRSALSHDIAGSNRIIAESYTNMIAQLLK